MKEFSAHPSDEGTHDLDRQILELFRAKQGGTVSGEELSTLLKVSRTAVWKHIKTLKELGYTIEAVPSQGYRLLASPDLLIPVEIACGLGTDLIGRKRLICFRETDSTNDIAFKLAEEGAVEGTVVAAEAQRRGKGRRGRHWESPPGVNLYCSVILRPPILPPQAPQLTFLSAVAVARAVAAITPLVPAIKWPNDILVGGRKVAGLLNEMSAETEKVNFIVLGIGININMAPSQFPPDLRHPASSLATEGGAPLNRLAVTRALLEALDTLYASYLSNGFPGIRKEWLERSAVAGRRVRVSFHDREVSGEVTGIDDDGALLLKLADGGTERVLAGDVTIL